jgi:WD40 repeat protein
MAVTKGKFPDAINPIFRAMMEEPFGGEGMDIVKFLYDGDTSTRPEERLTSISGLPKFPKFTGTLTYKDPVQGFDVTATHVVYAMGVQITRETWDDDQHGKIKRIFSGFKDAAWETRQDDGAQLLNNAFVSDTEFYNHTEGVSLCNNSHTTPDGDVSTASGFDNLSTTALSATALSAARYTMRLFKDFKGVRIDKVPDTLIVPAELEDEALKISQTKMGLDTAAGDKNVQAGRFNVVSSTRLTDTNNFFVVNKGLAKKSFIWYDRVPFETDRMESFDQFNFKARAYMRYSNLWLFWQGIMGFQVS